MANQLGSTLTTRRLSTFLSVAIYLALLFVAIKGVGRIRETLPDLGEQSLLAQDFRGPLGVVIIVILLTVQPWRAIKYYSRCRELRRRNPNTRLFNGTTDARFLKTLVDEQRFPENIKNSDMRSMTFSATKYGLEFWSRRSNPLLVLSLRWDEIAHIDTTTDLSYSTLLLFPVRFHRTTGEVLRFYPTCNPESSNTFGYPVPDGSREVVAALMELRP